MDYFLGSIITLVVIATANFLLRRSRPWEAPAVRYSQSHVHSLLAPMIPEHYGQEIQEPTQATKYLEKIYIRVVFHSGKAYWIKNNALHVADVKNKEIQYDTATQVDTMSMDKVQLNKLMTIVEKLTEGSTNDYWDAGKS